AFKLLNLKAFFLFELFPRDKLKRRLIYDYQMISGFEVFYQLAFLSIQDFHMPPAKYMIRQGFILNCGAVEAIGIGIGIL
ncbi:hypothetical protein, partial [Niastella populi]|uniref:hypothetical protein n=1 Tax=Niastella populi TaxID=550983 RepID=UPI001A99A7F0